MAGNKEKKIFKDKIHLYLAIQRKSKQGIKKCIRTVIKDEELDLKILESKLQFFQGEWRIYKTVNARDPIKASKWLIKHLIDNPHKSSIIDTLWRTALLQRECKAEKYFMFDVDTKKDEKLFELEEILQKYLYLPKDVEIIESPNGWHYITEPFDSREVCKLDYVTLLRDGYVYIKTVNKLDN